MRLCIQRVHNASVTVDNEVVANIGKGLLVLVGIERTDTAKEVSVESIIDKTGWFHL